MIRSRSGARQSGGGQHFGVHGSRRPREPFFHRDSQLTQKSGKAVQAAFRERLRCRALTCRVESRFRSGHLQTEVMALRARIDRWLVGAMALLTGHFPQVGIVRIRSHAGGLHGQLFGIAMATEANSGRHGLAGWAFFVAALAIQPLCAVAIRQKRRCLRPDHPRKVHGDNRRSQQDNQRDSNSFRNMKVEHFTDLSFLPSERRGGFLQRPLPSDGVLFPCISGGHFISRVSAPRHSCRRFARKQCTPSDFRRPGRRISAPTRSLPL